MEMTTMTQLMGLASGVTVTVVPQQKASKAAETTADSFDKLVQKKQQSGSEEAPKAEETSETNEASKTEETTKDGEQPSNEAEKPVQEEDGVPEELKQQAAAMALMMEYRPEIQYIEAPETAEAPQTVTAAVLTEAPVTAEQQPQTAQVQSEQTVLPTEPENAVEAAPVEAPVVQTAQTEKLSVTAEEAFEAPVQKTELENELPVHFAEKQETDEQPEEADVGENVTPLFEDVKATPVKVAEPMRETVELEAPDAKIQLSEHLTAAIDLSQNKVELTLTPESLGKLTVEISRGENGTLSIVLSAANPKAAALLERHAGGLQELLAANTRTEVRVEVQESQESPRQFLNPDGNPNERQQSQQHREGKARKETDSTDFLQRLRLGLTDLSGIA